MLFAPDAAIVFHHRSCHERQRNAQNQRLFLSSQRKHAAKLVELVRYAEIITRCLIADDLRLRRLVICTSATRGRSGLRRNARAPAVENSCCASRILIAIAAGRNFAMQSSRICAGLNSTGAKVLMWAGRTRLMCRVSAIILPSGKGCALAAGFIRAPARDAMFATRSSRRTSTPA